MIIHSGDRQSGFTLIEMIVTLVLAAIMASMMFAYITGIPKSVAPVTQIQATENLHAVMENIVAYFDQNGQNLSTIKPLIGAEGSLVTAAQNTNFGGLPYYVVENHYITFDATNHEVQSLTATSILKVSISLNANGTGGTLTNLLIPF